MKPIPIIFLLVSASSVFGSDDSFAKQKGEMLSRIEARMQKLQEHKECVSASTDKETLKKCHMTMKAWKKHEQSNHFDRMKDRLEKKKVELDKED